MAKFKVGDIVKRTVLSPHLGINEGDVCVVTAVNPEHGWLSVNNIVEYLDKYPFNPNCFELVQEKTMSLQDNIDRMKQELAAMEAQLQEEQKRNAYIGDRKVNVELTLDELGYLVATIGKDHTAHYRNWYEKGDLFTSNVMVYNALHTNKVKVIDTQSLYDDIKAKFVNNIK